MRIERVQMLTHICLSDLHAGAPNSLLMDTPFGADRAPVSSRFSEALAPFLAAARAGEDSPKPQLVLLGDVLDLQFSDRTTAMHNGSRFLTGLAESGHLDPCVLATAGNHDHAFWTDARLGLEIDPDLPEALTHATPAFAPTFAAQSRMLQAVLTKAGFQSQDFRYPNIGVANENRTVVLHHGHFAEAEYIAISHLIDVLRTGPARDLTVADIAAENGGWIDFLLSLIHI